MNKKTPWQYNLACNVCQIATNNKISKTICATSGSAKNNKAKFSWIISDIARNQSLTHTSLSWGYKIPLLSWITCNSLTIYSP